MFRKLFSILLAALLLLGGFSGCFGNSKKTVDLAQIEDDVYQSSYWQDYGAFLISCCITKRQTNPEEKTDYVYVQVIGENRNYRVEAYYKLTYVLYNEGWLLEELIPDPKTDPIITPLRSTPEPTAYYEGVPAPDERNALLSEVPDEYGEKMISITVLIPAHASLCIHFPNQDDYSRENTDDQAKTIVIKMPPAVFYPKEPPAELSMEYTPEITIRNADGSSYRVNCPSFTMTIPEDYYN